MKTAIHSFKGGTGKTTLCANMATSLALKGKRVGILDCDLTAAGLHVLFGIGRAQVKRTLNDVLWGKCKIGDAVLDLTKRLNIPAGKLYFIPASTKSDEVLRIINEGYDPVTMVEIFREMAATYKLDYLFLDTHPGVSSDVMLTLVTCNVIILVMRPDEQDVEGALTALDMIKRFERAAQLVLNMASADKMEEEGKEVERAVGIKVHTVPFYPEVSALRSRGVFILKQPDHPFASSIEALLKKILR